VKHRGIGHKDVKALRGTKNIEQERKMEDEVDKGQLIVGNEQPTGMERRRFGPYGL